MAAISEPTQVLEFDLGETRYCLNIEFVSQIVEQQTLTTLPQSPPEVAGVTDLRGETTTVIDPRFLFDIEADRETNHIIVFDSEAIESGSSLGWQIDAVHRVSDVASEEIDESSMAETERVKGLLNRDDGFVVWVTPEPRETSE